MLNPLLKQRLFPAIRVALAGTTVLWLVGCTATPRPSPPPAQQPASSSAENIMMTVNEIQLAEHRAYKDGFDAGRAYERHLRQVRQASDARASAISAPGTSNVSPSNADSSGARSAASSTTTPKPNNTPPQTSASLESLPSVAPVYSTSGPAQKLSP